MFKKVILLSIIVIAGILSALLFSVNSQTPVTSAQADLSIQEIPGIDSSAEKAIQHSEINDPINVAIIDGTAFSNVSVDLFYHAVKPKSINLKKRKLLEQLIENHVIAEYALATIGKDALTGVNRVEYSEQAILEQQFHTLITSHYKKAIDASVKQLPNGLEGLITQPYTLSKEKLASLTKLSNSLEYKLTEEQIRVAKNTALISYKLPHDAQEKSISLWDVYSRQNIQGRVSIHQPNVAFLKQLINTRFINLYVQSWAQHESGLSPHSIATLKTILQERRTKDQYAHIKGLLVDIHDDTPQELVNLGKQVTQEEINAYYKEHKDDFKLVTKAKGRQLKLYSQEMADKVYQELTQGLSFSQAIEKYSTEADKNSATAGETGWIAYNSPEHAWLRGILFHLDVHAHSKAFRSPRVAGQKAYWLIVESLGKEEGYQKADSKGVKYVATKHIAQEKALENFKALRHHLLAQADIRINPALLN